MKSADDRAKKSMADAARLADELRAEQEHSMQIEKLRKGLESHLKEMQVRLDEAEAQALKGGKKMIAKLEQRVCFFYIYWVSLFKNSQAYAYTGRRTGLSTGNHLPVLTYISVSSWIFAEMVTDLSSLFPHSKRSFLTSVL